MQSEHLSEKAPHRTTSSVYSFDLGVWRVYKLRGKPLLSSAYTRLRAVSETMPYFLRMVMEIMHFEPLLTVVYLLAQVWSSFSVAISVYLASRLFYAVERSTGSHEASASTLETIQLLVARLLWLSLMALANLIVERTIPDLERRINSRYEALSMEVHFNQSSNIFTQNDKLSPISWDTFSGNVVFLKHLVSMISQVLVLIQTAIDIEDPLFAILSLIIPTRQILLNAGTRRLHDTREPSYQFDSKVT
ncbi:hypothetical protein BDZ89DRAFT_248754 [Hymenopellis radicata]|nr:hypothetical protein BDZ89DRAFT_248754 [Hymenopellis radicata]